MVRVVIGWCGLALLAFVGPSVAASEVAGTIHVVDGDTFDVGETRVRLFGIDAPENDQACETEQGIGWSCGAWVTNEVCSRFKGAFATCSVLDTDRYQRAVVRCIVNGEDVARRLVLDGLAFAYRRYSMDYDLFEKQAAVQDTGLHSSRVQSPSHFRQTRAIGRIPPSKDCRIKGNISKAGERIYHMPGQRDYERTGIRLENDERWFCTAAQAETAWWRRARR